MNDYLSFEEVAGELKCNLKRVRSLVIEAKTLKATRITKNGLVLESCGLDSHFPYDLDFCCHLDDEGLITSDHYESNSNGKTVLTQTFDIGFLRVKRSDLKSFITEHPCVQQSSTQAQATPAVSEQPPAIPGPATVLAIGASDGPDTDMAGPLPLTTAEIAFCFAGLRCKTEKEWKVLIGKGRGWLERCLVQPGTRGRGGAPKLWNPVFIGATLVRDGYAKPNSVRAKFQNNHLLKPWFETWKTYEADNLDTE